MADEGMAGLVDADPPVRRVGQPDTAGQRGEQVVYGKSAAIGVGPPPHVAHDLRDGGSRRACEALGGLGQVRVRQGVAQVMPQDALAGREIRQGNDDVPVQAAGTPDGGVDLVGQVGGPDDDHALPVIDAIAELRIERERAQAALARIETFPPKQGALDARKVENFVAMMREKITAGPMSFRKAYLRSIIDAIEVDEETIRIIGSPRAIEAEITGTATPRGFVRSFVPNWRARKDSNLCPPDS